MQNVRDMLKPVSRRILEVLGNRMAGRSNQLTQEGGCSVRKVLTGSNVLGEFRE
jgi:hypothetical protein